MIDNDVVTRIARKIRASRLKQNLTLQQLAARTQVSKGLLSKIENSKTIPSLPVFIALVQSLDISLKEFFQDMILFNGREYLHVKKDTRQEREDRTGFNYQYILSRTVPACSMEAALLTLQPDSKGQISSADGYEFEYVISGTCEYLINNESIVLEEGDAIYFDATVPHVPVNNSPRELVMLVVCFMLPK
jgi:transcriptional regulator with XRE-family HTH domain